MIITNKTEIAFNTDTEKDFIARFLKDHSDWERGEMGKFTTFTKSKTHYLNPEDEYEGCKCGNCTHAKTQTLSTGIEQLVCEISSDWHIVHPDEGCNRGTPKA